MSRIIRNLLAMNDGSDSILHRMIRGSFLLKYFPDDIVAGGSIIVVARQFPCFTLMLEKYIIYIILIIIVSFG